MLDHWGYRYLNVGTELSYMEFSLDVHLGLIEESEQAQRNSDLQSDDKATNYLFEKCQIIEGFLADQDLGPIPSNLAALMAKIHLARDHRKPLYAIDVLKDASMARDLFGDERRREDQQR